MKSSLASQSRREWILIFLLLLIMLLKGILWSLALPLWQGPDEEDHYNVIQFIGELGRLPDREDTYLVDEVALSRQLADVGRLPYAPEERQLFSDYVVGPGEKAFSELPPQTRTSFELQAVGKLNKATPLYYIIASLPYRVFRSGDLLQRAHIQRIFALLMSSGLVIVSYLITRLLFPTNAAMRITVPTLVVFHPMITQITAVVSVDGFYFLIYSLLIFFTVLVLRDNFNWRYGIIFGVLFAAGFLTKPTMSGYAPIIALVVFYDFWRGKERRKQIVTAALLMGGVILLLTSWWLLRSLRINDDLFYFNPVLEGHRIIQNPFYDYSPLVHMFDYYRSVWGGIFVTWWAHFGWLDTALPPWIYTLLRLLTFAAIFGLIYGLFRIWPLKPTREQWKSGKRSAPIVVWLFMALTLIMPVILLQIYDLTFWWEYGNGRGLQGRYWLGTVVPMMTLWTAGLLIWLPSSWKPAGHTVLRGAMILLNFVSLLAYVIPRYYL